MHRPPLPLCRSALPRSGCAGGTGVRPRTVGDPEPSAGPARTGPRRSSHPTSSGEHTGAVPGPPTARLRGHACIGTGRADAPGDLPGVGAGSVVGLEVSAQRKRGVFRRYRSYSSPYCSVSHTSSLRGEMMKERAASAWATQSSAELATMPSPRRSAASPTYCGLRVNR